MIREEFLFYLKKASLVALKFAENYVKDKLIADCKYNVMLNTSTDDATLVQFDVYPEDTGKIKQDLTDNEVVDLLCRNNKVPVWIDINVLQSSNTHTTLNLLCSGRYSDNKEEFYYERNGFGPFGIKSPKLPFGYKEGEKFSL